MPLAFATPPSTALLRTTSLLAPSALCGYRVHAAPTRRAFLRHTASAAVEQGPPVNDSGAADEEVLDEAAMRAAEIHEVLIGLQDFKKRIIEDATKLAKKVRAPKKQLEAALASHPDILKINGHIAALEEELKTLGDR